METKQVTKASRRWLATLAAALAGLAAVVGVAAGAAQQQLRVTQVDVASVPTVAPSRVIVADEHTTEGAQRIQDEIVSVFTNGTDKEGKKLAADKHQEEYRKVDRPRPGHDPDAVYDRLFPFGEMGLDRRRPGDPVPDPNRVPLEEPGPWVEAIGGHRVRFVPSGNPRYLDRKGEETWRWEVPKELKESWPSHTMDFRDKRYVPVLLNSTDYRERNPFLVYFDLKTGFKWQREVPLKEAAEQAPKPAPEDVSYSYAVPGSHGAFIGSTRDGKRILVLIPRADLWWSVLFVYSSDGTLLRTVSIPGRKNDPRNGRSGWNEIKLAGDNKFFMYFTPRHPFNEDPHAFTTECYLVDSDGNLLYRFVDDKGYDRGASLFMSPDERYVRGDWGGTPHYHYLWEVPK